MFMPEALSAWRDVTDGTSNTFLFGEISRFKNEPRLPSSTSATSRVAFGGPPWTAAFPLARRFPADLGAFVIPRLELRRPDTTGAPDRRLLPFRGLPPDWLNHGNLPIGPCYHARPVGLPEHAPRGGNFAMADGSVKFVRTRSTSPSTGALGPATSARSSAPTAF